MTAPARTDALAILGEDVRGSDTAYHALVTAGMAGMNVRKVPVLHNGKPVRGKWLLEDDRNGEALPGIVVGDDFTPYQYEQVAEVLDVVARRTGAVFDRAGYMDVTSYGLGGARGFISMRLPHQLSFGGDKVDAYIAAFMSHGTGSNLLTPTGTRVECANQQPAMAQEKYRVIIRHTSSVEARHRYAGEVLTNSVAAIKTATYEANQLLAVKTTDDQFRDMIERAFPIKGDGKGTVTRHQNKIDKMMVIRHGDTNRGIVGTAWGDYQTMLEFIEWHQRIRGGDDSTHDDEYVNPTTLRARRALIQPSVARDQARALEVVRELAGLK